MSLSRKQIAFDLIGLTELGKQIQPNLSRDS